MIEQPVAIDSVLAEVWRDVLHVPRVDAAADFFDLGGSSMQATQIVSRVRDLLDIELPVSTLERAPAFGEFVAVVTMAVRARQA
jgi:acyl carrier protein